jgi:hypothetical protein
MATAGQRGKEGAARVQAGSAQVQGGCRAPSTRSDGQGLGWVGGKRAACELMFSCACISCWSLTLGLHTTQAYLRSKARQQAAVWQRQLWLQHWGWYQLAGYARSERRTRRALAHARRVALSTAYL